MNYASNNCVKFVTFFLMNFEFFDVCKKEKERARGKKEAIEGEQQQCRVCRVYFENNFIIQYLSKGNESNKKHKNIKHKTKNINNNIGNY